jgi:hypothetical protein
MIDVEVAGRRELETVLTKAASRSVPAVRAVVERGALNVKTDWRQRWGGIAHAPALPAAVTYDVRFGFGSVSAEIGPDKEKRQGALGNLIEFGSENNAPIPGGLPALQAEEPRFERALADLGERQLT